MDGFPFDIQTLKMSFTSWIYNKTQVKIFPLEKQISKFDFKFFQNSGVDLKGIKFDTEEIKYHDGNYDQINIYLNLQRNGNVIYNFVVIPSIIIGFVMLFFYNFPMGDFKRIIFAVQLLMCMAGFILIIITQIPLHKKSLLIQKSLFCVISVSFSSLAWIGVTNKLFNFITDLSAIAKEKEEKKKTIKYDKIISVLRLFDFLFVLTLLFVMIIYQSIQISELNSKYINKR